MLNFHQWYCTIVLLSCAPIFLSSKLEPKKQPPEESDPQTQEHSKSQELQVFSGAQVLKLQPVTPLLLSCITTLTIPQFANFPCLKFSACTEHYWILLVCKSIVAFFFEKMSKTHTLKEKRQTTYLAHEGFCYSKYLSRNKCIGGKKAAPNPNVSTYSGILMMILQQRSQESTKFPCGDVPNKSTEEETP